mgnify:CR=1 FL=1
MVFQTVVVSLFDKLSISFELVKVDAAFDAKKKYKDLGHKILSLLV